MSKHKKKIVDKSEREKLDYSTLKKGQTFMGHKIIDIYYANENFILYKSPDGIRYDNKESNTETLLSPIKNQIAKVRNAQVKSYGDKKIEDRIASAIVECYSGNVESALNILDKTYDEIISHRKVAARLYYIGSSIVFVIINALISICLNLFISEDNQVLCVYLFTIATFGSLGGFLSMSLNFKSLDFDIDGGAKVQVLTAFSRIFISMVSSLIIYAIIKSDIALGFINDTDNKYIFYTLAAVSGFSEKFVPNIIKSIEKENKDS